MNKEVIYLEAEDDITDILTKLQQAEQKLVALVPPKKSSILRSFELASKLDFLATSRYRLGFVTRFLTLEVGFINLIHDIGGINWLYMNKEVIYLEAEDDITDILTKLTTTRWIIS